MEETEASHVGRLMLIRGLLLSLQPRDAKVRGAMMPLDNIAVISLGMLFYFY